jgi:hypothetical protein
MLILLTAAGMLAMAPAHAIHHECLPAPDLLKSLAEPQTHSRPGIPHPRIDIRQIIDLYLGAVDGGQLLVFNMTFDRSMIEPQTVEYIYGLETTLPIVRVFSILTTTIPLPIKPDMHIYAITSVIDQDGDILQTIVHCGQ